MKLNFNISNFFKGSHSFDLYEFPKCRSYIYMNFTIGGRIYTREETSLG